MNSHMIPTDRQLPPSMDYEFLRREGLKYIEQLGSAQWTDYNAHDPGITLLEALSYAITELGYRSGFEMKDLLHGASGQVMYPARQILANHPFTIADYRKLLVDLDGVNNAWLYTDGKQEVDFQEPNTGVAIHINGLYAVVLDLERDELLGDLNTGDVELESPEADFILKFECPRYADVAPEVLRIEAATATLAKREGVNRYELRLAGAESGTALVAFSVTIPKHPATGHVDDGMVWALLQTAGYAQQLADTYLAKMKRVGGIFNQATRRLLAHRNLGEDFVSIAQVAYEEVALCVDIDVAPGADLEQVQAAMFFAIGDYLAPSVEFHTLQELLDRGLAIEEIYNGVALDHGFVDPQQLEGTQLRTHVYASDLISLLMDIEGVLAVRNLVMTKYDEAGKPVDGFVGLDWCMRISGQHKPVLSLTRSKILLYKDGFPFHANSDEVSDTLAVMQAQRTFGKRKGYDAGLPAGNGRSRDTRSFRPVQYDLPKGYGVGEAGLPPHADGLRKAQQRQLKGYLLLFEQLLADFLAQLTNAGRLFSVDDIKQTYFAQYLDGIKDTEGLLSGALHDALAQAPTGAGWQGLYENQEQFAERRGRFLDHLLARFAESFDDFTLLQYRINFEAQTTERISHAELIEAKIHTLKNYPEISANRSKAFNYFPQTDAFQLDEDRLWDAGNVSGLEKRIRALTGIGDATGYLVEHVLLRPRTTDSSLLELCDADSDCACEWDLYSFRASVVFPYWPDHFDNMAFRKYMEDKLQEEAPAHIQLKVCWISEAQLDEFERLFHAWKAALAAYFDGGKADVSGLKQANDDLLALLPQLKTVHPVATLHNCAESNIANNPVMLGKTNLGTFLTQ